MGLDAWSLCFFVGVAISSTVSATSQKTDAAASLRYDDATEPEAKRPLKYPLKIHMGCNNRDFGEDWVHIDGANYPHLHSHDVTKLPFPDKSASLIYSSHLFAYFDRAEAAEVLAEWHRVLMPGGVVRIAVPDFGAVAKLYLDQDNDVELDTFVSMLFGKWQMANTDKRIYHKTTYDRRSLSKLLEAAGFGPPRPWRWQLVDHGRFDDYSQAYYPHMAKDAGVLVSLNLEAVKKAAPELEQQQQQGQLPPASTAVASLESSVAAWSLAGAGEQVHGPRHVKYKYDREAFPFDKLVADVLGVDDFSTPASSLSSSSSSSSSIFAALGEMRRSSSPKVPLTPSVDEIDWDLRRFYERLRDQPPDSTQLDDVNAATAASPTHDTKDHGASPPTNSTLKLPQAMLPPHELVATYHRFVAHVARSLFPNETQLLFQATPSLRIQRWNNTVVPFHSDGDATGRHPAGERNFLVPLTPMRGSASVFLESGPGKGDFKALELDPGEVLHFEGNTCMHGNEPHLEPSYERGPRLSLDFRVLPVKAYRAYLEARRREGNDSPAVSEAKGKDVSSHAPLSLVAGDYYRILTLPPLLPDSATASKSSSSSGGAHPLAVDVASAGSGFPAVPPNRKGMPLLQMRPWFDEAETKAVQRYLSDDGFVTEFKETAALEQELATLSNAHDVVMTTSGTSALYLALAALGVGPGDEVVVPDLTMVATANAVAALGATVVFADVDPHTLCLSVDTLAPHLSPNTKVVVFVALNNRAHHLPSLVDFVKQLPLRASDGARVALLEDSAQSVGATWQGRHLGTWGDLGTFSFSSPKIISTGQGGAVVIPKRAGNGNNTDSAESEMAARVRRLKNFGRAESGADAYLEPSALNFKFTDLQAVVGRVQLQKLPGRVVRMRQLWERYEAGLRGVPGVTMLRPDYNTAVADDGEEAATCESRSHGGDAGWIPWFIDMFVEGEDDADAAATRSALLKWLKTHRVGARPMYPSLSSEPAFAAHPQAPSQISPHGSFPVSRRAAHAGLFLPSSTLYDNGTVDHVCALIRIFFTSGGRHGVGATPQ